MQSIKRPVIDKSLGWATLCGLLIIYAFMFQNARGVWEPSEGRYVCVANEMVRSGNFIFPKLNDDLPHWTKPPLTYWALAISIKLFGHNTFAVRLPNALAFLLTIVFVYCLGLVFIPDRPWLQAVIYATFLFPFVSSNIITTDGILTMLETAAMSGFAAAYWSSGPQFLKRYGAVFGWMALGLAFMTKGPPALLPFLAFILFHFLSGKNKNFLKALKPGMGASVFLIIGCAWYLYVMLKDPELLDYFIRNEVAQRVFTGQHHRNPQWYGAFLVYLPTLIFGTLPWTFFVFRGIYRIVLKNCHIDGKSKITLNDKDRFLLFWFFVPLVVFFVSKSRLALYILPLFVPMAVITAGWIDFERIRRKKGIYRLAAWCTLLLILRGLSGFFPSASDNKHLADQITQNVGAMPIEEIIFVETKPSLGLSLYFNAEVEKVRLKKPEDQPLREEYLEEELTEAEPKRLWIVPLAKNDAFQRIVENMKFMVKPLGRVKGKKEYELYFDNVLVSEKE